MAKESIDVPGFGRRELLRAAAALAPGVAMQAHEARTTLWNTRDSGTILEVGGLRVGHNTLANRPTGCTVVLFDEPAIAGVDVRGAAPGTRETDLLNPVNSVETVNAFVLAGGSAYGLDAASGVMRYLEEKGVGLHVGSAIIPIIPAAILFDLGIGDPKVHPDAASGYAACQSASKTSLAEGNAGAGAGATVGKLFGMRFATKSGIGTASWTIKQTGLTVGAIVAVNAVGDVFNHGTREILAGARNPEGPGFLNTTEQLMRGATPGKAKFGENTTIGVVATNAKLNKTQVTKVAQMAHDGLARVIDPVHTPFDGDTIFAAARGRIEANLLLVGTLAAEVVAQAINRAVIAATGIPGFPACRDVIVAR